MVDFMSNTYDLIKRNSRAQIVLLQWVGRFSGKFKRASRSLRRVVNNPAHALSAIESHKGLFAKNLVAA